MTNWRGITLLSFASCTIVAAYTVLHLKNVPNNSWIFLGFQAMILVSLVLAVTSLHIYSLHPSGSHSLGSLLRQYLIQRLTVPIGWLLSFKFYYWTRHVRSVQESLMLDIMQRNAKTDYGQDHGFDNIKSAQDLKKQHPLTKYDNFEDYINREARGETNVIVADKIVWMAITSGTTGRGKLIPIIKRVPELFITSSLVAQYLKPNFPGNLRRVLNLNITSKPWYTEGGIRIGPISNLKGFFLTLSFDVSPNICSKIHKETTVLYLHALYGMAERDVGHIEGITAQLLYSFFNVIEDYWQDLCNDIETGAVNKNLDLAEDIRDELSKHLVPDPLRALELRHIFKQGNRGVAKRIWPHLKTSRLLATGSLRHYTKMLFSTQMEGVMYWSHLYAASEGLMGLGFTEDNSLGYYTMQPNTLFYEFIPLENVYADQPDTLLLDEIKDGDSYEVVLTNVSGLTRYRLGDVIKVVGHLNQCPIVEYQYRLGNILNMAQEFTTETLLYDAIQASERDLNIHIDDYTATESVVVEGAGLKTFRLHEQHYILFVEVSQNGEQVCLNDADKQLFDEKLRAGNDAYDAVREATIGTMEVLQVQKGTFARLKAAIMTESSNQQFKMPRVLRKEEFLQFLLQSTV